MFVLSPVELMGLNDVGKINGFVRLKNNQVMLHFFLHSIFIFCI